MSDSNDDLLRLRRPPACPTDAPPTPSVGGEASTSRLRLASESLLAGRTEIEITHGSAIYRLRLTSLGKLILTK